MNPIDRCIQHIRKTIRGKVSLWIKTEITINKYKDYALSGDCIGISEDSIIDEPLIVSLTTYGKRIHEVYLVVESIMRQTIRPNKIILWLDEDEFNDKNLPLSLKRQISRGLTISYCKNYKSYKKIIPTLQNYPGTTIITIDDDVIYPIDMIERMIQAYNNNKVICYYRGRIIGKSGEKLSSYSKWKFVTSTEPLFNVMPTGVGGIMYPKDSLNEKVLDEDTWSRLCPAADDVWLRAMTMLNGYKCKRIEISGTFDYNFISLENNQDIALANSNYRESKNDWQINAVFFKLGLCELLNRIDK